MGERQEVEVVCGWCKGEGETVGYPGYAPQAGPDGARYTCLACHGQKTATAFAAPGSLTAARLRLADAAEAWWMATGAAVDHSREWATLLAALSALRTARGEG